MLVYSRDSFADLAVATKQMLNKINAGKFHPDKSRVERISEMIDGKGPDDSEDEPPSPLKPPGEESSKPPRDFQNIPLEQLVVHKLSGVVHVVEHQDFLLCGRGYTSNYIRWVDTDLETADSAPCAQCARGPESI